MTPSADREPIHGDLPDMQERGHHPSVGGGAGAFRSPVADPDQLMVGSPDLDEALERARGRLLSAQEAEGYWCGELEADSTLESEFILLLHFLGEEDSPRIRKAARRIRELREPTGGWAIYPGGPDDPSASVKAYFALKLLGDDPDSPPMKEARRRILELGGIEATNTYTRIYLALFGQYEWRHCPAIPPEMVLLPTWFPINLYEMSSWSRAIFVPLSILWGLQAQRPVPEHADIRELRTVWGRPQDPRESDPRGRRWRAFFVGVNEIIRHLDLSGVRPLRERGLKAAESWILERQEGSDGMGAIFPGILNTLMALHALGYDRDHPAIRHELRGLERLILEDEERVQIQPTRSPVWDTAQALTTLAATEMPADDPALQRGARWLLDRQVDSVGDWSYGNPGVEPGGWYFEFANEVYPDCDDTAEVLLALAAVDLSSDPAISPEHFARERSRGLRWLLSMQNEDGGWAAFDRGCVNEMLRWVPFADHNAMLDPSCADITGRVLRLLAKEGRSPADLPVRRGIGYLLGEQLGDGSWYGRWGCNYIYGTWLALEGLTAHGAAPERVQLGAKWLLGCQNDEGGWGESLASYDDPKLRGEGPSTAAQTAWALRGLICAGHADSPAVYRGIRYLLDTQEEDGSWRDTPWTGTGFPRVFYLRYGLYDLYFPLLALATWRVALPATSTTS